VTDDPHRQPPKSRHKPAATTAKAPLPDVPGTGARPLLAQDFDARSLYALRAAVAAHVNQAGMPESRVRDIVLAVHELAVNAIRHGAGHGRLLIQADDRGLDCQVTDDGKPPTATPGPGRETPATGQGSIPWPSQHGHGLWVAGQLADHLNVQSGPGGTTATASFTLPPPSQPRPVPR
jgi:anti-sigma regulatory factor (Ser/Thr protein kinase)